MSTFNNEEAASSLIRPVPQTEPTAGQLEQIERRFGAFLHFGVNTFGNTEWSDGGIHARSYRPAAVDADQWIKTVYEAGMNFVILITKHHDGFCLWETDTTQYSVKYSGNPTDVVAQVAAACKKYGIKLGLYYSLWDRSADEYKNDFENRYVPYMLKQLTELMDGRYGDIVELWLDGAWDKPRKLWQLDKVYDHVKRLQPGCQIGVNHTVGVDTGLAEFPDDNYRPYNCRENDPLRMFPSDFRLWDPYPCKKGDPKIYTFEGKSYYLPFEMTICSREGFSWFYSNCYEETPLMDIDETVEKCRLAFEEKNVAVINLPPSTEGRIVQSDIDHLMEISRRLGVNRV